MAANYTETLKSRLDSLACERLFRIDNPGLHEFVAQYIEICSPDRVFVCADTPEDFDYLGQQAIRNGEEIQLAIPGHTIHFDSLYDQARDKEYTQILLPKGYDLDSIISWMDRDEGFGEVHDILRGIMKGKEAYVCFFCLGPTNSDFSIPCVQLTDSAFVAHSEHLLYRAGYEEFLREGASARFFKFVHGQGELDERKVCKNLDKRRIYIDLHEDIVYSTNTQYGGNTIGLKKLAMRLAIHRGLHEGWLCEHMLILGIRGLADRVTYFTGAFPSYCGKTSTAMMDMVTIVGDDIAYIRKKDGELRAVNVERGMFGIIEGLNSRDDPLLWKVLHGPGEIIFSNVLMTEDGQVHWMGRDGECPDRGYNHSGEWVKGKKDERGKEIPCSHANARFALSLSLLPNVDPQLDDPSGVPIGGIVYGGRDSDTGVPVSEAFDWVHGIVTLGALLESETTAATLGTSGVREINPMSNLDFLSVRVGRYICHNLKFGEGLRRRPLIFAVNYFLRDSHGRFFNEVSDKKVWYRWMELRVHGEVDAIDTPAFRIPKFDDLRPLFEEVVHEDYTREEYNEQFKIRVHELLAKIDRGWKMYKQIADTPHTLFEVLEAQRQRLLTALEEFGDYILPDQLLEKQLLELE